MNIYKPAELINTYMKNNEQKEKKNLMLNFVDYQKNRTKEETPEYLDNKHTRRYLGKIKKDPIQRNKSFYTDDFIEGSLLYLIQKSLPGDVITIQIGPELSEICNGKDDIKDAMAKEEEIQYIQNIFQTLQQKTKKNISLKITSFEDEHPDFFAKLRSEGSIPQKIIPKEPVFLEEGLSIDTIASYLMWAMNICPDFSSKVQNTKVKGVKKTETNQPEYYGFIEIASRLYEFIHDGITTQGGGERQRKYDNLIRILLMGVSPELNPKLKIFQDVLKQYLGEERFSTMYIHKDAYLSFKKKEAHLVQKRKEKIRKIRRNAMITATALSGILGGVGGYQWSEYKREKAKEERNEKVVKDKLKDNEISFYGLREVYKKGKDFEKKEQQLESVIQSLWGLFKEVYGEGDNPEAIKSIIANSLLEKNEYGSSKLEGLWQQPIDYSIIQEKDLLIKEIVPENEIALARMGYNTIPYNNFLEYENVFGNTLKKNGEIIITIGGILEGEKENTSPKILQGGTISSTIMTKESVNHKYIGTYYDYHDYKEYSFIKVWTTDGEELVLASENGPEYGNDRKYGYTLSYAKEGIEKLQKIRNVYNKK